MRTYIRWATLTALALCSALSIGCEKSKSKTSGPGSEPQGDVESAPTAPGAGAPPPEAAAEEEDTETATGEDRAEDPTVSDGVESTGVAACDSLIKAYLDCDKLPAASRASFIEGTRSWRRAVDSGGEAARSALDSSCRQAHVGAASALEAVGCDPGSPPAASTVMTPPPDSVAEVAEIPETGITACDSLIATYVACDKLPAASRKAFIDGAEQWKKAADSGGAAAREALDSACTQAAEASARTLEAIGCSLGDAP